MTSALTRHSGIMDQRMRQAVLATLPAQATSLSATPIILP